MMPATFIMDTAFYGQLLLEPDKERPINKIKTTKTFFIVGLDVIEKELFETPAHVTYRGESTRKLLITLFSSLVDKVDRLPPIASYLADKYFQRYKAIAKRGKEAKLLMYGEPNLKIDFQIIAFASLKSIDIVVSPDKRTMLSALARRVYASVNARNGLRTPRLIDYSEFKKNYLAESEGGSGKKRWA